ncbi:MAG TPA: guanylate kinase [Flavobacteriales bacterium]|nr:guanylate kinase [Flavobacteriales bacterium]
MSKCIIFSAPSGAGKTTIVRYLLGCNLNLEFSISACSRNKRGNEYHGRDYYFLSIHEFKKKVDNNEFIEWEEVYEDNFYGTLKSEIDRIWGNGKHVIFDVDVQGGINLKKYFGGKALSIFVMPPSIDALEKRLRDRNTETEESLKRRVDKAFSELTYATQFDVVLLNDDLETACIEAQKTVAAFLEK